MMIAWLGGLLAAAAAGCSPPRPVSPLAVALIGRLGAFLTASKATMTARALRSVAVDWQVEVQPGADPQAVLARSRPPPASRPRCRSASPRPPASSATAGGTTQTTGPGRRARPARPATAPRSPAQSAR